MDEIIRNAKGFSVLMLNDESFGRKSFMIVPKCSSLFLIMLNLIEKYFLYEILSNRNFINADMTSTDENH